MPTGVADAPGAGPAHDVARFGGLPEGEIARVALLLEHGDARARLDLVQAAAGELAVVVEAVDVVVDAAVDLVGVAAGEEGLGHGDLLGYVAGGARLDVGALEAESVHVGEVAGGEQLGDGHRVQAAAAGLGDDLVLALVGVVGQVADVGDVLHVGHFVAAVAQPADHQVEAEVALGVADVGVAVDGRAADVHADLRRV